MKYMNTVLENAKCLAINTVSRAKYMYGLLVVVVVVVVVALIFSAY
jgi:hypothetical protein